MLLVNENHQQLNVDALKKELSNLDEVELLSQEDLETEIGNYYEEAHIADFKSYGLQASSLETLNVAAIPFSFRRIGGDILKKIKDFICKILKPDATRDEIIDAVIDALASIIPGGIILKPIVKKIIKFLLNQGIVAFCHFDPAV